MLRRMIAPFVAAALLLCAPSYAADFFWGGEKQFFDNSGDPLAAGTINTYDAGTTSARTVYKETGESNSHTQPIVLDSNGRLPAAVYVPTGTWKYQINDSGGSVIHTEDNVPGAVSTVETNFAREQCPTQSSASAAITVDTGDAGDCFLLDASGNTITVTLPSAITLGDGKMLTFTKTDNANSDVTINTVASQTMGDLGTSTVLDSQYETLRIVSDGANWHPLIDRGASAKTQDVPIGAVIMFSGEACPSGYTELQGDTLAQASYPELFALYSADDTQTSIYGESGSNFDIADTRGRFPRHIPADSDGDAPDRASRTDRGDTTTGDAVGTLEDYAVRDHEHSTQSLAIGAGAASAAGTTGNAAKTQAIHDAEEALNAGQVPGVNVTTESRPVNIGLLFCVFADSTP